MKECIKTVLTELNDTLPMLIEKELFALYNALIKSDKVVVVGVGRVMISLKAWVKRLKHLGIDINYFGSETESAIGLNDLVIVASSSGETIIPKIIAEKAKEIGTSVFYIGCTPGSTVDKLADKRLYLVGKSKFKTEKEYPSRQPMSTLFEQQLYLLGDILAAYIMRELNIDETHVKNRHANLE